MTDREDVPGIVPRPKGCSPGYTLYNAVISAAAPAVVGAAVLKGRLKGQWSQRFGYYPKLDLPGAPRIWVHGVSVGETRVAAALIRALRELAPQALVWQTVSTDTGRAAALELLPENTPVFTYPLDAYGAPARALARLKPDLVIILETELWPNFLRAAKRRGIRTMLANGRISVRSVKGYRRVRFLFKEVIGYLDQLSMIRQEDADRIVSLGADPSRVRVSGNAKYDLLFDNADPSRVAALRRELNLFADRKVLVAGSTREGEEPLVLEAYSALRARFPDLRLILAPRHVARSDRIESRIRAEGFEVSRRSQPYSKFSDPGVILVDVMGELFHLYGLADVAFCGGSLAPLGGQNPLEPAVWGRPVLYGPHMDDFLDAVDLLETSGAGRSVRDARDLALRAGLLLADPAEANRLGEKGRQALSNHHGASRRLAAQALELLQKD